MEGKRKNRTIWQKIADYFWLFCSSSQRVPPGAVTRTTRPSNNTAGHLSQSVKTYEQAVILDPSNPKPKFNLAVIYQDQGRLEEAEKLYGAIVDKDPGVAPAWSNLASIQENRGHTDEAEKSHRRAMLADPNGWSRQASSAIFC